METFKMVRRHLCVNTLNRELGHLAKAGPMLEAPAKDSWRGMPRQTAGNLLSALGTVLLLISPPSANATEKVLHLLSTHVLLLTMPCRSRYTTVQMLSSSDLA